jgi:hypothetical protein
MHPLLIPSFLFIAGLYFLVRNIQFMRNSAALESYLATSPKGKLWVGKYGLEKTTELANKYFLPLGVVIAIAMVVGGSWNLYRILPYYI